MSPSRPVPATDVKVNAVLLCVETNGRRGARGECRRRRRRRVRPPALERRACSVAGCRYGRRHGDACASRLRLRWRRRSRRAPPRGPRRPTAACSAAGSARGRRRFARGRGGSTVATHVKRDEGLVHLHEVAGVAVQLHDRARVGARQLDGRLRRLDVDERLVQRDDVAHVDLPGDDLGLDETFADVG